MFRVSACFTSVAFDNHSDSSSISTTLVLFPSRSSFSLWSASASLLTRRYGAARSTPRIFHPLPQVSRALFDQVDISNSGRLSYDEFVSSLFGGEVVRSLCDFVSSAVGRLQEPGRVQGSLKCVMSCEHNVKRLSKLLIKACSNESRETSSGLATKQHNRVPFGYSVV